MNSLIFGRQMTVETVPASLEMCTCKLGQYNTLWELEMVPILDPLLVD
jgi:hypothetical protein